MKETIQNFLKKLLFSFIRLFPLKNQIIFESNPVLTDNTYFVYREMLRKGLNKKYRMYWLVFEDGCGETEKLPENVYIINYNAVKTGEKLRNHWICGRTKYIIECNRYVHKVNPKQVRIHLKHGLPVKNASYYTKGIGDVDVICVPTEYWIDVSVKEYKVNADVIKTLGFPRNDVLVPKEHKGTNIIWMPTFIVNKFKSTNEICDRITEQMPYGFPCIENEETLLKLDRLLASHGTTLYVRLHPVQKTVKELPKEKLTGIVICDDAFLKKQNTTLYSFLCLTDALITDFSSVYYDYLTLDRPVALVTRFYKEYRDDLGMIEYTLDEYKERFPASFAASFEDLEAFVTEVSEGKDPGRDGRRAAAEKYMPAEKGGAAERVVKYLEENYGL